MDDEAKLRALWNHYKGFIADNQIADQHDLYSALRLNGEEFLEGVCELVVYDERDEEDEGGRE